VLPRSPESCNNRNQVLYLTDTKTFPTDMIWTNSIHILSSQLIFLRPVLPCSKRKLDDSSHLDVFEIAIVPDMLSSLFPSWSGLRIYQHPICLAVKKKVDDISRLDVVEIAIVPDMLPSLFPSWSELRTYQHPPCLAVKRNLMASRVSMLLNSRSSLTYFQAYFLRGRG